MVVDRLDFKNTIIIMTSNLGSELVMQDTFIFNDTIASDDDASYINSRAFDFKDV